MGYHIKWPKQSMAARNNKLLRTLFLVNLAGIMERADEALLPSVYWEIGLTLHVSPTRLGSLTLLKSIVQVICFPLAAFMSMHHNRANVIALGAMLWAIATFFVGASSTFLEVAISRALTGIGLAMVIPAIQSMVADAADPASRGLAFGWLQFTGSFGGIFGNVFALLLADTTVFGLAGWRASFHIIAILSVLVAFLVLKYAIDPRFTENIDSSNLVQGMMSYDNASTFSSTLKETFEEAKNIIRIPTFLAIVGQGVIGSFPMAAMSFAPMWLELIGFSHKVAATIIGLFIVSSSLGGLFGGWLGDVFARHLPNTGRIILAQFSSGIGVPFGAVLLLFLPYDSSTAFLHGAVFCSMGLLRSWCATATNDPIFAEIVPEKSRTSVYALDRSIESILSSFAPPLVGILAQYVFGYVSSSSNANVDTQNAAALGKALYVAFGIPYAICCLIYTVLYWTYPKDRDKALAAAQLESHLEISSGATQCFNSKLGYASLKQDGDCTKAQLQNNQDPNDLESSREEEHMLSNTG